MPDPSNPFAGLGFVPVAPGAQATPASPAATPDFAGLGFTPAPKKPDEALPPTSVDPESGAIFFTPRTEAEQKAANDFYAGQTRGAEKVGEGATGGMLPFGIAALRSATGVPFGQALQDARDYTKASDDLPASDALEAAGSFLPTAKVVTAARPLVAGARAMMPRAGEFLANALLGSGIGAATTAGHDIGRGDTGNLARDTGVSALLGGALSSAAPLIAKAVQAPLNIGQSLYTGARNIWTDAGQNGIAGTILREASGQFPNDAAATNVPNLSLRTAQVTGNPGIASLEATLAPNPGGIATNELDYVQNGRTPRQISTLAQSLVPGYRGEEPQILLNQISTRGIGAINAINNDLSDVGRGLWQDPALGRIRLDGPSIANAVAADVKKLPASFRNEITGPQSSLAPFLDEIDELPPSASIADLNSIRSRLLGVARDAGSGANPNSVRRAAASGLADSLLSNMSNDVAFAGRPSAVVPGGISQNIGPDGTVTPVHVPAQLTPAIPADPEALAAYQAARDFTRTHNMLTGYNEFNSILRPNRAGNIQGNAESQFGQFFDPTQGTAAGAQRLNDLAEFARTHGLNGQADDLENASRDYLRASILARSRAGAGVNAAGDPIISPASIAKLTDITQPTAASVPMLNPIATSLRDAGDAAGLLNRPSTLRGDTNSTTFEKLRNNELISAVLGQSGSSALGGALGAYGGYKATPEGVSPLAGALAGGAAGVVGGSRIGPTVARALAHTPPVRLLMGGQNKAVESLLGQALADPEVYNRLMNSYMAVGPSLNAPGAITRGITPAIQTITPALMEGRR
jgi:hypothetical protein